MSSSEGPPEKRGKLVPRGELFSTHSEQLARWREDGSAWGAKAESRPGAQASDLLRAPLRVCGSLGGFVTDGRGKHSRVNAAVARALGSLRITQDTSYVEREARVREGFRKAAGRRGGARGPGEAGGGPPKNVHRDTFTVGNGKRVWFGPVRNGPGREVGHTGATEVSEVSARGSERRLRETANVSPWVRVRTSTPRSVRAAPRPTACLGKPLERPRSGWPEVRGGAEVRDCR